jgi:5-(hydroxymethyl)furfural/furfural oxidase
VNDIDHLILGGGSSDRVDASRLSEEPARRVLLPEAGDDMPGGQVPEVIASGDPEYSYFDQRFHWPGFRVHYRSLAEATGSSDGGRAAAGAGHVLGGCSSINGQIAFRGLPQDYEEWAALGLPAWSFDKVEPYFRKLERDLDFGGPRHGKDGPIPIRRLFPDRWPPFSRAWLSSAAKGGPISRMASGITATAPWRCPSPMRRIAGSPARSDI